jgi:dolichyl-phosphate beta-glucosyltransferase
MRKNPYLSIIIPIYNEENRINSLNHIYHYLQNKGIDYEVILINDGSTDKTLVKAKKLYSKFKFELISYDQNKGKGFAIKTGMLSSKGQHTLFTDIDLSTPISEFNKFIPFLNNYDVIIGSRKTKEAKLLRHQPIIRETLGKVFTSISKQVLRVDVSDFTCGFKYFSRGSAKEIFKRQTTHRWGFDSEILFIAKKLGYQIKEIPVVWKNNPNTKVRFPQDIITSLNDLITIRYNDLKNKYET